MNWMVRICVAGLLILGAGFGCPSRQIVHFQRLDQATTVELRERDDSAGAGQDVARVVLDEPKRIERVVALVNAHPDRWQPVGGTPRDTPYKIVFRHDGDVTETFHFDQGYLGTRLADGDARSRPLSAAETQALFDTFQFTANFRSK